MGRIGGDGCGGGPDTPDGTESVGRDTVMGTEGAGITELSEMLQ